MKKKIKIILCILLLVPTLFVGNRLAKIWLYRDGIAILGYHQIMDDQQKQTYFKNNIYVMKVSSFEKQMQYLYEHGYTTLTLKQVEDYYLGKIDVPDKSVVLTFDDGSLTFKENVLPILQKYGFHATCFVIGSKLFQENDGQLDHYQYLRQEDLEFETSAAYYSHSFDLHHKKGRVAYVDILSKEALQQDVLKSKEWVDTTYYAYPYGISNATIKEVLKEEGVHLAFGYNENRKMVLTNDRYALPRFLMFDFMPMWYFKWII